MNNKAILGKVLFYVYVVVLLLVFALSFIRIGIGKADKAKIEGFENDWGSEHGRTVSLGLLPFADVDEELILKKALPTHTDSDHVLNLVSHNIWFSVLFDDREVYSYYPGENLIGKGYGVDIHHISIPQGAKEVKLVCKSIYKGENSAYFKECAIADSADFENMLLDKHMVAFLISMMIVLLGVVILVIHVCSFSISRTEYNMPALGILAILAGLWSMVSTEIPLILFHNLLMMRVIDYGALTLIGFPLVLFVNSVTYRKRAVFGYIQFAVCMGCELALVICRSALGIDLHEVNYINLISTGVALCLVVIMIVEDIIVHLKHDTETINRALYLGAFAFVAGSVLDLFFYYSAGKSYSSRDYVFMEVGVFIFLILMYVQSQRRLLHEHRIVDQQKFVNGMLKHSFSGLSPEMTIDQMLKYLCDETGAGRAFVYEDRWSGVFERTHTWGGAKDAPELPTELPFEGVVSDAYDAFREKGTLTVSNQKTFAKEHPSLEPVFMVKGVKTLVICPIERENGYIGLFGLENPPAGKIGWLASSARLIAFFIAVVLQTRDSQAELLRNSYVDHLTGVGNRRSLDEIRDKLSKDDVRYGMMMCDINGLKNVNDEHGHKAGDDMICDVASCLKDIFGDRRVFRMGGDEFLVVREGGNREQFENAVAEAWKKIESMGRSVSVGTAFSDEEADFEKMQRLADTRMYENKRVFYSRDGHDRRRGR